MSEVPDRIPQRFRWRRVALAAATVYLLYAMSLVWLQRSMLFPRHLMPRAPAKPAAGVESLYVEHEEGRTEAWLLQGRGVSAQAPGPVVFFAHGNAELIDYWPQMLRPYVDRGISVVLAEYRGYGRSDGAPSEAAIRADLVALYDQVVARPLVDASRVVLHGRSLGGGAVAQLAAHRPLRAMVLESTFRSVRVMARRFLLPGFLVADPFETEGVLAGLDAPVLLFHGRRDGVIPYAHGVALAKAAPRGRLVTYDCGHNDLPPPGADYWREIMSHLADAGVLLR